MTQRFRMLPLSICVILVNAAMAAFPVPPEKREEGGRCRERAAELKALFGRQIPPAARTGSRDSADRQLESPQG
jgi:hypothetical protein